MSSFERIGVVGAGQMGAGIAEVCARSGLDVMVCESSELSANAARKRVEGSLDRAARRGKLTDETHARAVGGLTYTADLDALGDRDIVIEAVYEDPAAKLEVLARLDKVVPPEVILASNTSSIPIINLAMATERAERVVGLHFFNPVPVMPLVEVVPSLRTSVETVEAVTALVTSALGKQVIRAKDRAGFVVNSLLVPYLLSAIRMLESGYASAGDVDAGMRLGCAHPMGPLELADLIGLDTVKAIAESMYDEFKEPTFAPPALLLRMVEARHLGRKTGTGFFEYAA
ncbi:MAG TPA: 3-hydroxybutyryl-CoA dehydrogenase [Nocardioidaceae bacterium]|nr:3-hydroxybutyryl-CoA dehydrogenase [Nocardioidaceae bacterium]